MQGYPPLAQVAPAMRSFESSYKSRIGGYSQIPVIVPELPTGIMADEIIEPGPGQVRAFFVHGGNPAVIVPDQVKMVSAFRSLELMVVIDPFMTPTAKLAHYVLPTRLQYERADLPCWQYEGYWKPYTRYTPPIAKPAQGMEVVADEYIFWGLLKRLGKPMSFLGAAIPMDSAPDTDLFLSKVAEQAGRSFDEIKRHELGLFFADKQVLAQRGESDAKFTLADPEVMEEITELSQEQFGQEPITRDGAAATHRLIVRRQRHMFNSISRELPNTHRRVPHNPAFLNPEDICELGIVAGDRIRITSRTASVEAVAEADPNLRRGCVSMSHGFGDLPDANRYDDHGVAVNALLTTDFGLQTINAMPRMTAVPVNISPADRTDNAWADNRDGRVLQ
jgi:anaerobic selenocysteine-containing dehydrogenase